jgi:hypothetical protein
MILVLAFAGCATAQDAPEAPAKCQNITREFTVGVPYSWDVMEDEENTVMANGCTLTTITHYVLDDGSGGGGAGGSAPDPRHCDVDGCGGPLDKRVTYSDPAEDLKLNIASLGLDTTTIAH